MKRHSLLRSLVATAALVTAACSDSTSPVPLDPAGVQQDLTFADAAVSSPATVSLAALAYDIDAVLTGAGSAAIVSLPANLLERPAELKTRGAALLASAKAGAPGTAASIPAEALGVTFEYDVELARYVPGERAGAPANGVRFVLYAIDPLTEQIAQPLVETGYVDITRTVTNQRATVRVQAYAGVQAPVKVIDYSATISGSVTAPSLLVAGFARNATDSLTFSLNTSFSLAQESITVTWRTALPSRGVSTRLEETIRGGDVMTIDVVAVITGPNGRVSLSGEVGLNGGSFAVRVNGQLFATISFDGEGGEPTITNAQGQELTEQERAMLREIFEWFGRSAELYEGLLTPVNDLLGTE